MENSKKKHRVYLKDKKLRTRFKNSFTDLFYRLVPYEIWQMIIMFCHLKVVGNLAQLNKVFGDFVDQYRRSSFSIALAYRRENQIPLAKKYLRICAKTGDQEAMFHLAMAYKDSGWGIKKNRGSSQRLFLKLANLGSAKGAFYCESINIGGYFDNGYCSNYEKGLYYMYVNLNRTDNGIEYFEDKAIEYFEKAAEEDNDEFAQYELTEHYPMYNEKAIYYALKAAEQGYKPAQIFLSELYTSPYNLKEKCKFSWHWRKRSSYQ